MAIQFREEEYKEIPYVPFSEGKHSKFKLVSFEKQGKGYLLKEFSRLDQQSEAQKQVKKLLESTPVSGSAYPLDYFEVSDQILGYICEFYENAVSFAEVVSTTLPMFTYLEKRKAILDAVEQLKKFHQNGFILSDIRLSNHLIEKQGGHLIDFEDSLMLGEEQVRMLTYHFYHQEEKTLRKNVSSQNEDRRRQAIVDSSLLLGVNLEFPMYALKDNSILLSESFKCDKKLNDMMQEVFFSNNIPYFESYLENFNDPEKNQFNGKKVNQKIQKQLIKWYH